MICGTCGCENASHLIFCQECGQRLGPRVAAPTPPIGVGVAPTPAAPAVAPAPVTAPPPVAAPLSPVRRVTPAPMASVNTCARCGSPNQPGIRYCVTCGNTLGAPRAAAAPPAAPAPAAQRPLDATVKEPPRAEPPRAEPPRPPAPGALTPVVVYPVDTPAARAATASAPAAVAPAPSPAPSANPPDAPRVCPRCRGTADDQAHFCRFCGAGLDAAPPPAEAAPKPAARPPVPADPSSPFWRAPGAAQPPPAPAPAPAPAAPRPAPVAHAASPVIPSAPRTVLHGAPAPAPAPPAPAGRIVVITKEGGEGASYPLYDQLDVGRSDGDVVLPEDFYLSPRHARILKKPDAADAPGAAGKGPTFALVDLESTNGVYLRLNTRRDPRGEQRDQAGAREVPLEDQDLFLVGQQVLKFEVVRHADEGLAPATQHGTLVFGTPAMPRYARLSQRSVEGVARDVFHVTKAETVLGRESGDIVFTDDPFLSRRHAAIKFDHAARRFLLADLGSSNGTFIQIRGEVTIRSGDQFRIGQQLFRVDLNTAP